LIFPLKKGFHSLTIIQALKVFKCVRKLISSAGKYTLEFKLEALHLVKDGQSAAVTAKVLDIQNQTLVN
jgi:hypothetical protein